MIHNRILILGASGFIGNALYKELLGYFDVYGTYCEQHGLYAENKAFLRFDAESDTINDLLEELQPRYIISAFNAEFDAKFRVHQDLIAYCATRPLSSLVFISSATVFDGQQNFPSYEGDKPIALSLEGKQFIALEKLIWENLPFQCLLLRLPLVLGTNSPRLIQLRQAIKHSAAYEVYPTKIVSITTEDKIAQQLHFLLNKERHGIFHLSSRDMVHHADLLEEIASKISGKKPVFKHVFSSNEDTYFAILPKENKLPKSYQISTAEVIASCTLKEEIITFKDSI